VNSARMGDTHSSLAASESEQAGRLASGSREAAARRALRLLATYFAAAPSWQLEARSQVSVTDHMLDELAAFVRMRVALAAAQRLEPLLRQLQARASFQYAQVAEDSVGAVRGQLNVAQYLRTRLRPESPRRYPVRIVQRRYATPENGLATYAALWAARELAEAPLHLVPFDGPERREVLDRRASLGRLLRQPILAQATHIARDARRRGTLSTLLGTVDARIEGGHIAASDLYREIVGWTRRFDPEHAAADPGSVEWAFYDDRFDTKLFEVWSLVLLTDTLAIRLGPSVAGVRPLYERAEHAIATWSAGATKISVYFQAALSRLGVGGIRWQLLEPTTGPLGGIPDIAVVIERLGGERVLVLVDPKLRQRRSAPTEEIYKLIGYFGNLAAGLRPLAAIVFYSPGEPQIYRYGDDQAGELIAIGVDPSDEANAGTLFDRVAGLVIAAASISEPTIKKLRELARLPIGDAEEVVAAVRQEAAVQTMLDAAYALPPGTLEPVRKSTAANLHEVWTLLNTEAATMVVTAEYFGQNAPADADHSGPLLGLAAACERVLYEVLFEEVIGQKPGIFQESQTLGSLIHALHDATRQSPRSPEGEVVANHLDMVEINPAGLRRLVNDLRKLNVEYRIPAAHREVVSQHLWVAGRSFILAPQLGLLSRLLVAFADKA
jgi:hypothetical protein